MSNAQEETFNELKNVEKQIGIKQKPKEEMKCYKRW